MSKPSPSHSNQSKSLRKKVVRLDNEISVLTPEYIEFQFRPTGPFRRAVALILDIIFIWIVLWALQMLVGLLMIVLSLIGIVLGDFVELIFDTLGGMAQGFILVSIFLLWWFSGAFQEAWFGGRTFGKRILNIQVVSTDGRAISLFQALIRNFLRLADAAPFFPIVFLLPIDFMGGMEIPNLLAFVPTFLGGLFVMVLNQRMQRLGDICAGTMVVHRPSKDFDYLPIFDDIKLLKLALEIPNSFKPTASLTDTLSLYISRRERFHEIRLNEISAHLVDPFLKDWNWKPRKDYDMVAGAIYLRCVMGTAKLVEMLEEKEKQWRRSHVGGVGEMEDLTGEFGGDHFQQKFQGKRLSSRELLADDFAPLDLSLIDDHDPQASDPFSSDGKSGDQSGSKDVDGGIL